MKEKGAIPRRPSAPQRRRAPEPASVKLDIYPAVCLLDPPVPELTWELRYTESEFRAGGSNRYQRHEHDVVIGSEDFRGRWAFPVGLVQRAVRLLKELGYDVDLSDHRDYTGDRFAVDEDHFDLMWGEDRRLLDAVRREPLGQIEVRGFSDTIETMRIIMQAYPRARVVIPLPTKSMAKRVRYWLNESELRVGKAFYTETWPTRLPRRIVCTYGSLSGCPDRVWDIVLLPEPTRLPQEPGVRPAACLAGKGRRVYAFVRPGLRLGRRSRLQIEGVAGPVIYRLPRARAGVRVLWLPAPSCAAIAQDADALQFKRRAYWHNDRRNEYIAAVARAFAGGELSRLRKYGVPFQDEEPRLRNFPEVAMVLLVASTEQGRELKKRLPDWVLWDAVPGNDNDDEDGVGCIITEARAARGELDADVVIRAGGSAGTACFRGWPALQDEDQREAIVMDFRDQFDRRAERDAKRRYRDYKLLEWSQDTWPGEPSEAPAEDGTGPKMW